MYRTRIATVLGNPGYSIYYLVFALNTLYAFQVVATLIKSLYEPLDYVPVGT